MKAAVLKEINSPLRIYKDIRIPMLRRGQVLVKVAYSGVCHSQLMEIQGKRGEDSYLPHLLGHEGSGIVQDIGTDVTKFKIGDRVILGWIKGDGLDVSGTVYTCGDETINAGAVTTFSNYAVVSENRCVLLPDGVPMDVAVLFGCALQTGAGIVTNIIKPEAGSTVAVIGLGGIGLSVLMATQLFNCKKVIAVDVEQDKLQLAKDFGATDIIHSIDTDPVDAIMGLTNGMGVDYSIEAAGLGKTIEQAFSSVRKNGGKCIFASHPEYGERISLDPYDLISGKQIAGSWGGGCEPDKDIPLLAKLYRDGRLPLDRLITTRYTLDNINQAIADLEARRVVRPLIEINKIE